MRPLPRSRFPTRTAGWTSILTGSREGSGSGRISPRCWPRDRVSCSPTSRRPSLDATVALRDPGAARPSSPRARPHGASHHARPRRRRATLRPRSRRCTPAASSRRPPTAALFRSPGHPYTRGLLRSVPRLARRRRDATGERYDAIPGALPDLARAPAFGLRVRAALPGAVRALRRPRARALCRRSPGGRVAFFTRAGRARCSRMTPSRCCRPRVSRSASRFAGASSGRERGTLPALRGVRLPNRSRRDPRPRRRIGQRQDDGRANRRAPASRRTPDGFCFDGVDWLAL